MQKIKVNDEVIVIAGKDRGKKGKVKKIFLGVNRVLVENVNLVKKTIRGTKENPAGGITTKEASIHMSNISLVDPKSGKPTRVRISMIDGKKVRVATKSGATIS